MTVDLEDYVSQVIALVGSYLTEKGITRGNPCDNSGAEYENDIFLISAYDWNEDNDPLPNFWFKPLNYQVEWYKHLGRGDFSNRPITIDDAMLMLEQCISSLNGAAVVTEVPVDDEFWEIEEDEE